MLLLFAACSTATIVADTSADADSGLDSAADTGEPPAPEPLELCINEFMSENDAALADETNAYPDWIELHNPGTASVPLEGWALTDDETEPDKSPLDGLSIEAGGFLLLWADGLTTGQHLAFDLASAEGSVALYAPDGRGSIVNYGAISADFSLARSPDCCTDAACFAPAYRGTPGESNVLPTTAEVTLLAAGSTWKYLDSGVAPDAGWTLPGFEDSAWASGGAPLGYGDTHQVTVVSYGADPSNKPTTTWFRSTVRVEGASSLSAATLRLLRDDGAVIYLNGVEVARSNMPEGAIEATTFASSSSSGAAETSFWTYAIDPAQLAEGANTFAVEIHQHSLDSSDLGFDLSLVGERVE